MPGHVKHSGRGEIIVGEYRRQPANRGQSALSPIVQNELQSFARPRECRAASRQNIEADQWTKMVMNCAGNAVTAIAQTSFAHLARNLAGARSNSDGDRRMRRSGARRGVQMPEVDWTEKGVKNAESLGEATSSTAQDIARGKLTEIDSLNGYIVRRGKEFGVPVPVNITLFALVKLIEESSAKRAGEGRRRRIRFKLVILLLIVGIAEAERNVHYGFNFDRHTIARTRPEFPACERIHGIFVQLRVELSHQLNVVD